MLIALFGKCFLLCVHCVGTFVRSCFFSSHLFWLWAHFHLWDGISWIFLHKHSRTHARMNLSFWIIIKATETRYFHLRVIAFRIYLYWTSTTETTSERLRRMKCSVIYESENSEWCNTVRCFWVLTLRPDLDMIRILYVSNWLHAHKPKKKQKYTQL